MVEIEFGGGDCYGVGIVLCVDGIFDYVGVWVGFVMVFYISSD